MDDLYAADPNAAEAEETYTYEEEAGDGGVADLEAQQEGDDIDLDAIKKQMQGQDPYKIIYEQRLEMDQLKTQLLEMQANVDQLGDLQVLKQQIASQAQLAPAPNGAAAATSSAPAPAADGAAAPAAAAGGEGDDAAKHLTIQQRQEIDQRSIFVSGLDPQATPEDLSVYFEKFGTVNRVTISTDRYGISKGHAFVEYLEADAVTKAVAEATHELGGKQLKVVQKRTNLPGHMLGGRGGGFGYDAFGGRGGRGGAWRGRRGGTGYSPYGYRGRFPRGRFGGFH